MSHIAAFIEYIILFVGIVGFTQAAEAATSVGLGSIPDSVDQSQDFSLDVSLLCTGCTSDSYLRAVFYGGGTSYFGFTQDNNGNWVNAPGGSCTQYYKVASGDLLGGSWSGRLRVKPDKDNAFFNGPGDYLFKIGRYTGSCSSPVWSGETTVTITGPTATPTPGDTPTPTPTPRPTPTPTPTLPPTPTNTPVPTLSPAPTGIDMRPVEDVSESAEVLGVTETVIAASESAFPYRRAAASLALVGAGLGILSAVSIIKR